MLSFGRSSPRRRELYLVLPTLLTTAQTLKALRLEFKTEADAFVNVLAATVAERNLINELRQDQIGHFLVDCVGLTTARCHCSTCVLIRLARQTLRRDHAYFARQVGRRAHHGRTRDWKHSWGFDGRHPTRSALRSTFHPLRSTWSISPVLGADLFAQRSSPVSAFKALPSTLSVSLLEIYRTMAKEIDSSETSVHSRLSQFLTHVVDRVSPRCTSNAQVRQSDLSHANSQHVPRRVGLFPSPPARRPSSSPRPSSSSSLTVPPCTFYRRGHRTPQSSRSIRCSSRISIVQLEWSGTN